LQKRIEASSHLVPLHGISQRRRLLRQLRLLLLHARLDGCQLMLGSEQGIL
jgi:hypothetical protein